ncbi:MAG: hypothetical protein LBU07_04490 [Coriobacteriales bacterium]|nr:hypothetical protein [Coriobacteriales bacterium]
MTVEATVPTAPDVPKTVEPKSANPGFPAVYVHPYSMLDKNGTVWNKAICVIPEGTKLNGIDISGYKLDTFVSERNLEQKLNGHLVTPFVRAGTHKDRSELSILIWKEDETLPRGSSARKESRREFFIEDPVSLAQALKQSREAFKEARQKEMEAKSPA